MLLVAVGITTFRHRQRNTPPNTDNLRAASSNCAGERGMESGGSKRHRVGNNGVDAAVDPVNGGTAGGDGQQSKRRRRRFDRSAADMSEEPVPAPAAPPAAAGATDGVSTPSTLRIVCGKGYTS